MTLPELSFSILVLLVTPGPTNTLLLMAGSDRGLLRALWLIPAEIAGYLTAILALMVIGTALVDRVPMAQSAITVLAGAWVAILAVRLYRPPGAGAENAKVSARLVYGTTFLNPKALIFGLVLLPGSGTLTHLSVFLALVTLVATVYAATGAGLARRTAKAMPAIRRAAAMWLAVVSATLMLRGLSS